MRATRPCSTVRFPFPAAALLAAALLAPASSAAQESTQTWLDECRGSDERGRAVHCEVRETTLGALEELTVNARPNGGISVQGWDRNEILVRARIRTQARTDEEASALAREVRVATAGGRVATEGPRSSGRDGRGWSVGYEVFVPRRTDLELTSTNGGLRIDGVEGELELSTTNGGISLQRVAGDVRGRTTNGGLDVRLDGDHWDGAGLDLQTTNGGVTLTVPEDYSASLETRTRNGGLEVDFPLTVQGRIGRELQAQLGRGGAPIRVETTNGRVSIRRS